MELLKLKEALQLYKNNYKWVMLLSFASTCLLLISIYLLTVAWQYIIIHSYNFITSNFALTALNASVIILFLIIFTISIYLLFVCSKYFLSLFEPIKPVNYFKSLFPTFGQYWDFWKVSFLMTLASFIASFAILRVLFAVFEGIYVDMVPVVFVIISFVVVTVLFLYIMSRFFPAMFISINKNQGSIKSLKEAWLVTREKAWKIVAVMILISIFCLVPNILALFTPYTITLFIIFQLLRILIIFPIALIIIIMMFRELSTETIAVNLEGDIPSIKDISTNEVVVDQEIKTEVKEEIVNEEIK